MTEAEQAKHFGDEIDRLVDRFSHEYQLTYGAMIGALQFKVHQLCIEAYEDAEENDE